MYKEYIYIHLNSELQINRMPIVNKGLSIVKYTKDLTYHKVIINEEDSWFIYLSSAKLPSFLTSFCSDLDFLIMKLNSVVPFGSFYWKTKQDQEEYHIICYKTYQRCTSEGSVLGQIREHIIHHEVKFIRLIRILEDNLKSHPISEVISKIEESLNKAT